MLAYFAVLLLIGFFTSRKSGAAGYFTGNHQSPWYAVAFGLIGDSLSGVTYISVPGAVGTAKFSYLQVVIGYVAGYWAIALVLLPLYYRMQLTSIYTYLGSRYGSAAQRTGAFYFILSRLLGAAGRLFLAAGVMQLFLFEPLGVPFPISVSIIILLMLLYTLKGGIKTLVWTDVFQSGFLLLGVVLSLLVISSQLGLSLSSIPAYVMAHPYSEVFVTDWKASSFWGKQIVAGAFIAFTMTGLDQNMMQKNLSCRTLGDAQKNLFWFSGIVLIVNILFLSLGVLLYGYLEHKGLSIPVNSITGKPMTDQLFPELAFNHLGALAALVFITGLTAATFNSADSVLTTLTTSFYIDFLHKSPEDESSGSKRLRQLIHISFGIALLAVILIFQMLNDRAVIDTILILAGYTYGPLLGLFLYGLMFKARPKGYLIVIVSLLSPVLSWIFNLNAAEWLGGYKPGYELLLINALITMTGLGISALIFSDEEAS
jgi:Na+/proline symporter